MKLLLAIDGSEASERAVKFVADVFAKRSGDVSIALVHVVESLPDYMLITPAQEAMGVMAREWEAKARESGELLLTRTTNALVEAGLDASSVSSKLITEEALPGARSVVAAVAICEELATTRYDVVCLGRRGTSPAGGSFPGSVAEKVLREAAGVTVWVVD